MPTLTIKAQDVKGIEQLFVVYIDRVMIPNLNTPYTATLEVGNHYVSVLAPEALIPNYPVWTFRKWIDLLGNTIGTTQELTINLQTDTTIISVYELVQPMPSWVIPTIIGLVIGIPSIFILYRYVFRKKR